MKGKSFAKRSLLLMLLLSFTVSSSMPVYAKTLQEIRQSKEDAQKQQEEAKRELDDVKDDIDSIQEEADALNEEIEELDAELVDLLLSVSLLESDIEDKEYDIEVTKSELEAAENQVKDQEKAMACRIKFMYEKGQESYFELLIESKSMAEAVNKAEYSEKLYSYDRLMLERYQFAKQEKENKEKQLSEELAELEEIKEDLNAQTEELNALIEEKKETADDFNNQLDRAKKKASEYESKIKAQSDNLKKLNQEEKEKIAEEERKAAEEAAKKKAEEAARRRAAEEAANNNDGFSSVSSGGFGTVWSSGANLTGKVGKSTAQDDSSTDLSETVTGDATVSGTEPSGTSSSSSSNSYPAVTASGSGIGTDIANYGLLFVGNPYVAGGTSLTNGCDCSGFTQGVYSQFGIKIPRSSYAQSEGGVEVPYDQMQAGDIIYYGGHVAIYIGNNQIVHASTAATGIKVSNASYRSIITIRRYY